MDALFSVHPAILIVGGAFALLALMSPQAALFILIPTIALAPEVKVGDVWMRPDDLMLTVVIVAWILRRLSQGRSRTPLDAPLLAYFGAGLVATLWGAATGTADLYSLDQLTGSGLHVLKRLELVLFFFVLTDVVRTGAEVRRVVYVFMASLAGLSAYAMGRFFETGRIALAPVGAAVHEPGLAAMLNVALALGLLVAARSTLQSVISGAVMLGSLWMLPFSLGRNFMVSTAVMFGLVAMSRKRALLLLVPVAWLLAPLVLPDSVLARTMSIRFAFTRMPYDPEIGAGIYVPERLTPGLTYGRDVLTSSPVLGWGLASVSLGSVDSEYWQQFISTGIVGFAVFLWLVARVVRMAREAYREAGRQGSSLLPLVAGLQHCLIGYALYSVFSPSISASRAGAFFIIIIGLLAALYRELVVPARQPDPGPEGS